MVVVLLGQNLVEFLLVTSVPQLANFKIRTKRKLMEYRSVSDDELPSADEEIHESIIDKMFNRDVRNNVEYIAHVAATSARLAFGSDTRTGKLLILGVAFF